MKTSQKVMASIVAVAVFSIAVAPIAPSAFAEQLGSNGEDWGAATAFFAKLYPGSQGEHASDPGDDLDGEPGRTGLGNLKKQFNGDWCLLLDFLNGPDDDSDRDKSVLKCDEEPGE